MGLHFQLRQSKVAVWIKALEPILLDCLNRLKLTPVRESEKLIAVDRIRCGIINGSERTDQSAKVRSERIL